MVGEVTEGGSNFTAGGPKPLFDTRTTPLAAGARNYDVTNDGQRFVMIIPVEESSPSPLTVDCQI